MLNIVGSHCNHNLVTDSVENCSAAYGGLVDAVFQLMLLDTGCTFLYHTSSNLALDSTPYQI